MHDFLIIAYILCTTNTNSVIGGSSIYVSFIVSNLLLISFVFRSILKGSVRESTDSGIASGKQSLSSTPSLPTKQRMKSGQFQKLHLFLLFGLSIG